LAVISSSKDFYSQASYGGHIKGPVEHMVAMMKHLGVDTMPGVPDFNQSTIAMGQHLLNPPSVAGWAGGKAWITPGLLIARGNVAREVLVPDMTGFSGWNFTPVRRALLRPSARAAPPPTPGLHGWGPGGAQADSDTASCGAVRSHADGRGQRLQDNRGSD